MKVGYARVSSIDGSQDTGLDTQIEILFVHIFITYKTQKKTPITRGLFWFY